MWTYITHPQRHESITGKMGFAWHCLAQGTGENRNRRENSPLFMDYTPHGQAAELPLPPLPLELSFVLLWIFSACGGNDPWWAPRMVCVCPLQWQDLQGLPAGSVDFRVDHWIEGPVALSGNFLLLMKSCFCVLPYLPYSKCWLLTGYLSHNSFTVNLQLCLHKSTVSNIEHKHFFSIYLIWIMNNSF